MSTKRKRPSGRFSFRVRGVWREPLPYKAVRAESAPRSLRIPVPNQIKTPLFAKGGVFIIKKY